MSRLIRFPSLWNSGINPNVYFQISTSGGTGATGPSGSAGRSGPTGVNNSQTGPTGPTGLAGSLVDKTGPTGPQGPTGTSYNHLIGATGPQGPIGPTGPNGGDVGIGPTGPTGGIGPTGPPATDGSNGPVGIFGLDPLDSTSKAKEYYAITEINRGQPIQIQSDFSVRSFYTQNPRIQTGTTLDVFTGARTTSFLLPGNKAVNISAESTNFRVTNLDIDPLTFACSTFSTINYSLTGDELISDMDGAIGADYNNAMLIVQQNSFDGRRLIPLHLTDGRVVSSGPATLVTTNDVDITYKLIAASTGNKYYAYYFFQDPTGSEAGMISYVVTVSGTNQQVGLSNLTLSTTNIRATGGLAAASCYGKLLSSEGTDQILLVTNRDDISSVQCALINATASFYTATGPPSSIVFQSTVETSNYLYPELGDVFATGSTNYFALPAPSLVNILSISTGGIGSSTFNYTNLFDIPVGDNFKLALAHRAAQNKKEFILFGRNGTNSLYSRSFLFRESPASLYAKSDLNIQTGNFGNFAVASQADFNRSVSTGGYTLLQFADDRKFQRLQVIGETGYGAAVTGTRIDGFSLNEGNVGDRVQVGFNGSIVNTPATFNLGSLYFNPNTGLYSNSSSIYPVGKAISTNEFSAVL